MSKDAVKLSAQPKDVFAMVQRTASQTDVAKVCNHACFKVQILHPLSR